MKNNILQINKDQKGVILVMAMLILSIMMISVLSLSKIIMGEINMTRNIDNSIVAFYSAESGIEKALYYVKYSNDKNNFSDFTDLENNEYTFDDDYERKFSIIEASTEAEYWERYDVEKNKPVHVDIIDPSGDISSITRDKDKYRINWRIDNCAADGHSDDRVEITLEYFDAKFKNVHIKKSIATCGCSSDDYCIPWEEDIDTDKYYRFSFEAIDNPISYIRFNSWDKSTGIDGILSEISIKVEGSYRNSIQHLQARLPSLGSVSDIFSYVIFSGSTLSK